jgi:two-component system NarL family sensor kinase
VLRRRPLGPRAQRLLALRGFGWMGLVSLVVVAIPAVWVMSNIAAHHALQGVAQQSEQLARLTVAPALTAPAVRGDPSAVASVDAVVRSRMSDGSVRRIMVWNAAGTVVYSDRAWLRGRRFPLPAQAAGLFADGGRAAAVGDADTPAVDGDVRAEGTIDPGTQVEGFAAATARSGDRVVVEASFPGDVVTREQGGLLVRLLPVVVGALAALFLLQLPPALTLARRVQGSERSRARLLRQSLAASDRERRRIAQTLHDDVVQDLSAVGYALESVEQDLDPSTRPVIDRARAIVQRDVGTLRDILTSVYPPDLESGGLAAALDDLAQPLVAAGVTVDLSVDDDLEVSPAVAATVYRATREALQNIRDHASPQHVLLRLSLDAGTAVMCIYDDGVGFDPAARLPVRGHFGLRLIHDIVTEAGGEVSISSGPGYGTCIRMRVPPA